MEHRDGGRAGCARAGHRDFEFVGLSLRLTVTTMFKYFCRTNCWRGKQLRALAGRVISESSLGWVDDRGRRGKPDKMSGFVSLAAYFQLLTRGDRTFCPVFRI